MWMLVGLFMLLTVSGGTEVTLNGYSRQDVVLPCNCSGRDLKEEFRWQIERRTGEQEVVLKINKTGTYYGDSFRDRVTELNNCSLQLKNISAVDQGEYKCSFHKTVYQYEKVNLVFCGVLSSKPLPEDNGLKVFQCDVQVCDDTSEIRWILDGQDLSNSSETNITTQKLSDKHISTLKTEQNLSSNPECQVEKKLPGTSHLSQPEMNYYSHWMKVIPVLPFLGLCFVLFCRWIIFRPSTQN
ncbi:uncharacterized protein LOC133446402 [Cololabis saira]|uniref:uncharacterized protein LOC133446402 n=1 Tax=Cololabis saira TaxID=129043 RepID=UPI002AD5B0B6|nr:uncharacterized protein LOC133446402 [Cololabis saira]XP_061580410.1 uncharacterized protein LOC133446402 [Cololabis saira]